MSEEVFLEMLKILQAEIVILKLKIEQLERRATREHSEPV